jgi:hypothetical protein
MAGAPVLLSQRLLDSLMADQAFLAAMPEFAHIRTQSDAARLASTGCRSCPKRRIEYAAFAAFQAAVMSLQTDRLDVFKGFAGATKIQYQGLNRLTGQYEVRIV